MDSVSKDDSQFGRQMALCSCFCAEHPALLSCTCWSTCARASPSFIYKVRRTIFYQGRTLKLTSYLKVGTGTSTEQYWAPTLAMYRQIG